MGEKGSFSRSGQGEEKLKTNDYGEGTHRSPPSTVERNLPERMRKKEKQAVIDARGGSPTHSPHIIACG